MWIQQTLKILINKTKTVYVLHSRGFTLIEFMLYMTLVVCMVGLIAQMGVIVFETRAKTYVLKETEYSAEQSIRKIRAALEEAQDVTQPSLSATSSILSITSQDVSKNPTVFDLVDGRVRMQEGASDAVFISSAGAFVTGVTFTNTAIDEQVPATISMDLTFDTYGGIGRLAFFASSSFKTTMQTKK